MSPSMTKTVELSIFATPLHRVSADHQCREPEAGDENADRLQAAEQGRDDGREAEAGRHALEQIVMDRCDLDHSGQSAKAAGDQKRPELCAHDVDAGRLRRLWCSTRWRGSCIRKSSD